MVTCQLIVLVRRVTVWQVPLTDDGVCEGGLLLFACGDGRLMHVQRRVGSILAHDGDAVHGVTRLVKGIRCRLQRTGPAVSRSCSQPIAAHYVTNHLVSSHACFALARYGLYALRGRSSATHVSPSPDMPQNVAASVWQCDASSNRLQVQSVTRVFSHSANGGDDYFVLCLLSSSRRLLSPSHFECSSVQRAIDAAWIALCSSYDTRSRCQSGGT